LLVEVQKSTCRIGLSSVRAGTKKDLGGVLGKAGPVEKSKDAGARGRRSGRRGNANGHCRTKVDNRNRKRETGSEKRHLLMSDLIHRESGYTDVKLGPEVPTTRWSTREKTAKKKKRGR